MFWCRDIRWFWLIGSNVLSVSFELLSLIPIYNYLFACRLVVNDCYPYGRSEFVIQYFYDAFAMLCWIVSVLHCYNRWMMICFFIVYSRICSGYIIHKPYSKSPWTTAFFRLFAAFYIDFVLLIGFLIGWIFTGFFVFVFRLKTDLVCDLAFFPLACFDCLLLSCCVLRAFVERVSYLFFL